MKDETQERYVFFRFAIQDFFECARTLELLESSDNNEIKMAPPMPPTPFRYRFFIHWDDERNEEAFRDEERDQEGHWRPNLSSRELRKRPSRAQVLQEEPKCFRKSPMI